MGGGWRRAARDGAGADGGGWRARDAGVNGVWFDRLSRNAGVGSACWVLLGPGCRRQEDAGDEASGWWIEGSGEAGPGTANVGDDVNGSNAGNACVGGIAGKAGRDCGVREAARDRRV